MMRYRCIAADPPWLERGAGKVKRGADRHYPLMPTDEICQLDVASLADDDAHLWLWVTNNFLPDGLRVMNAWGFRYVTNMAWGKVRNGRVQIGLGQYLRGSHELCLFGVRGRLPYAIDDGGHRVARPSLVLTRPRTWRARRWRPRRSAPDSLVIAERGRHSAKPPESYETIEAVSPGPRLEMFCRTPRSGWDAWGNEVGCDVKMPRKGQQELGI